GPRGACASSPARSPAPIAAGRRSLRLREAPSQVLVANMLVIALARASALAASGHHVKPSATQTKQQSAPRHQAAALVLALGSGLPSREGAARVRALQRRLARAGYAPGPIDGLYGPRTEQAVVRFQAARGLLVDGIAGPQTLAHLGTQRTPHQITRPRHPAG